MRYPAYIEKDFSFPQFYRVRLNPPSRAMPDPAGVLEKALVTALDQVGIKPGQSVAVGVGSRGINQISSLVSTICRCIRKKSAVPFIVPSMGSHGSATPQGQTMMLEKLGVTPDTCNAEIKPDMDTVQVATVCNDVPVFFSGQALAADHSICINRIKPHTKFKGDVESGLYKMMVVGMGKHQGALAYHNNALKYGFYNLLLNMGDAVIKNTNVRLGIGVVEDRYDQVMDVQVIPADKIRETEPLLLKTAKENFPCLPYQELDVLAIRQIGKEISGSGMDPNVTGRTFDLMEDDFSGVLNAKRVVVLDLSAKTCGNAIGLGNADIITEKVFADMDYEATLMNALTSMSLKKAFTPVRLPNKKKALQAAFQTIGPIAPADVTAVIIQDTMHTTDFLISQALVEKTKQLPWVERIEKTDLVMD
jgi:hypothetical protein